MWRLAAILLLAAIAVCVLAWLVSGKTVYRRWAVRLAKAGLAATLVFFGLLFIERLTA